MFKWRLQLDITIHIVSVSSRLLDSEKLKNLHIVHGDMYIVSASRSVITSK